MLYSIIPPVLIILSLAGIILFFMKKAPQIAVLSDEERILEQERMEMLASAGFFKKIVIRIKNIRWEDVKHWLLAVLEKLTRRARIVFLKLESRSKNLSDDIRTHRNNRIKKIGMNGPAGTENPGEDDIIKRVREYQPEKKKKYFSELKKAMSDHISAAKEAVSQKPAMEEEEKQIRPIISDKIVKPNRRSEMKDRLEELLIERIAANPKDTEAYERLGEYYMEIGNLNDAMECFKQVLKLDPLNRNVKYRMRRLENLMLRK